MEIISRIFNKKYLREHKRVKIQNFHKIVFLDQEKEFEVYNVSVKGIGFLTDDKNLYKKDDRFFAVVRVLDELCDIEVEVRQHTKNLVGCRVIGSCEIYEKFIQEYFYSELKALSLKKIDREKLADDDNGEPHWLYGDYNHEIYYTVDRSDKITTMQINYHGFMFIYDNGKITTGLINDEIATKMAHKGSSLIDTSDSLPKEMMEYMFRFIESAFVLDIKYKKQIMDIMRKRFKYDWSS